MSLPNHLLDENSGNIKKTLAILVQYLTQNCMNYNNHLEHETDEKPVAR